MEAIRNIFKDKNSLGVKSISRMLVRSENRNCKSFFTNGWILAATKKVMNVKLNKKDLKKHYKKPDASRKDLLTKKKITK